MVFMPPAIYKEAIEYKTSVLVQILWIIIWISLYLEAVFGLGETG